MSSDSCHKDACCKQSPSAEDSPLLEASNTEYDSPKEKEFAKELYVDIISSSKEGDCKSCCNNESSEMEEKKSGFNQGMVAKDSYGVANLAFENEEKVGSCSSKSDDCCAGPNVVAQASSNGCCSGTTTGAAASAAGKSKDSCGSSKVEDLKSCGSENARKEPDSCCKSNTPSGCSTSTVVDLSGVAHDSKNEGLKKSCGSSQVSTCGKTRVDSSEPVKNVNTCSSKGTCCSAAKRCSEKKSLEAFVDFAVKPRYVEGKGVCCVISDVPGKPASACGKGKSERYTPGRKSPTCCEGESVCSNEKKPMKGSGRSEKVANYFDVDNTKVTYGSFKCCKDGGSSGCFDCLCNLCKDHNFVAISCDIIDGESEDIPKVPKITTTKLRIQNICCGKEAELMKKELEPLHGVEFVSVNVVGRIGMVKHDMNIISATQIVTALNDLHLGVSIMESGQHDDNAALNKEFIIRLGTKLALLLVLGSLFIPIIIGRVYMKDWRKWVAIAEIIIGGLPILRKTVLNWMKKIFIDINVLMLIAVIGTIALQEWIEGATVVFVFAIAEVLQEYCTYRVQKAISGLMVHIPDKAVLAETGKSVPVEDVVIGTMITVCAGEKIPLDGNVTKGQASVDESSITGESIPIEKSQGDKTYSGTIVQNGYLEIVTTSDSQNSTVSKVTQLVQEAQGKASHTEEIMNKFAKIYTPVVLTVALLIFAIPAILAEANVGHYAVELHWWGVRALIVLLIACPCALVMSVPMPMVCGITAAARNGVLIKGGTHMENLARINTVALDKTGTLTEGRFRVNNIKEFPIGMKYNDLMEMIAALEIKSSHPVASAIVNHYSGCITDKITNFGAGVGLPDVFDFTSTPGLGLSGQVNGHVVAVGNMQILRQKIAEVSTEADAVYNEWSNGGQTVIFVTIDNKLAMMIGLADTPRPTAKHAIQMLKDSGIETIMLTGDSSGAAAAVMNAVGAKSFIASMKPEDKLQWVRDHQGEKRKSKTKVAMVGDGVNDGPSLAAADVGIAIGACATALAIESAGVALMSDSLVKIPETFVLSKFTRRVVFQNIALALVIKIGVMVATLAGSLTLWMAVLSDVVALLLVILNGFRPLLWKQKEVKVTEPVNYSVDYVEAVDDDYEGMALIKIEA